MCEVDVFEHHRFCDEFSHLVNACFVATRRMFSSVEVDVFEHHRFCDEFSLLLRLDGIIYMFQMI